MKIRVLGESLMPILATITDIFMIFNLDILYRQGIIFRPTKLHRAQQTKNAIYSPL